MAAVPYLPEHAKFWMALAFALTLALDYFKLAGGVCKILAKCLYNACTSMSE